MGESRFIYGSGIYLMKAKSNPKPEPVTYHPVYHYKIEGAYNPPEQLGIHGDKIRVDLDACIGDKCIESGYEKYNDKGHDLVTQGACVDTCPEAGFVWAQFPGHPTSTNKAIPANQDTCPECQICEVNCPVNAIQIIPDVK